MMERKGKYTIAMLSLIGVVIPATGHGQDNRIVFGISAGKTETNDRASAGISNIPDGQFSLDNINLAAKGTAWSLFAGYELIPRLDIEAAYADLAALSPRFGLEDVRLEPEEFSLRLRYEVPLPGAFSLNLLGGISHAGFSTSGRHDRPDPCRPPPPGTEVPTCPGPDVTVTPAEPESEIGNLWGLGLSWKPGNNMSLDLQHSYHDLKVVNISQYSLGVRWRF